MPAHIACKSLKPAKFWIAAAALAVCTGLGCDNSDSPDNQISSGLASVSGGMAVENYDEVSSNLESLTQNKNASPTSLANTYDALGQVNLAAARAIRNDANARLVKVERQLQGLAGVSSNLADVNRRIADLRAANPEQSLQAIDDTINLVRGSGDAAEFNIGDVSAPTIGGLRQEISRLQGQIADLEQQVSTLDEKHKKALQDADAQFKSADEQSGDTSMDTFRAAVDLKKQASNAATQKALLNGQLDQLNGQLEIAQAKVESMQQGVKNIEQIKTATETEWEALQGEITAQQDRADQKRQSANSLLSGGEGGTSLVDALAQAQSQVAAAKTAFAAAVQRFDEAASQSASAGRGSVAPPKAYFDLIGGSAQREQGELLLSAATSAYLRQAVAQAAENSGVTLPDTLSSSAAGQSLTSNASEAQASLTSAAQKFEDAQAGGGTLAGNARAAVSNAASYLTGFTQYSLSQVATLQGDQTGAEQALNSAVDAVRNLDNVDLMPLPTPMRNMLGDGATPRNAPGQNTSGQNAPATAPATEPAVPAADEAPTTSPTTSPATNPAKPETPVEPAEGESMDPATPRTARPAAPGAQADPGMSETPDDPARPPSGEMEK